MLPDYRPHVQPDATSNGTRPITATPHILHTQQVAGWLAQLIDPDQTVELRALDVAAPRGRPTVWGGWFDGRKLPQMAEAALNLSGRARGVYFTLNPIAPESATYTMPSVRRAGPRGNQHHAAEDADVIELRRLLIDIDPVKAEDARKRPANAAERANALELAHTIERDLAAAGFPQPVLMSSGNGAALVYRLPPLAVAWTETVQRFLRHLSAKYSGPLGKVDTSTFNASRIYRCPGTLNMKGEPTADRPHERCVVVSAPTTRDTVPVKLLAELADLAPARVEPVTVATATPAPRWYRPATEDRAKLIRRARAYNKTEDPAVSRDHGHDQTYHVCCTLIVRFGLTQDEAYPILAEWNERCDPPWTERALRRKLEQVDTREKGPRGALAYAEHVPAPSTPADRTPIVHDLSFLDGPPYVEPEREKPARVTPVETPVCERLPAARPHTSGETPHPSSEVCGRLREIIGMAPPRRPCRYPKVRHRQGCHASTAGKFDSLRTTCGKCQPCQEQRRYHEKLLHCRIALACGTHVWVGTDDEWEALRKRLERVREPIGHAPFPASRVTQAGGVSVAVLAIDVPVDEPTLTPVTGDEAAQRVAKAIEDIPFRLEKGTWRIRASRNWKTADQPPKPPLTAEQKQELKRQKAEQPKLYSNLGKKSLPAMDFDDVIEKARARGNKAERVPLKDIRVEDRIVIECEDGDEHAMFREVYGLSLMELQNDAIEMAEQAKERAQRRKQEREERRTARNSEKHWLAHPDEMPVFFREWFATAA